VIRLSDGRIADVRENATKASPRDLHW